MAGLQKGKYLRPSLPAILQFCNPAMCDHPSYFQFRDFPAAIHSTAVCSRRTRVSFAFASVIQSTYSRLWLAENASNVARALLFRFSTEARSGGTRIGFDDLRRAGRGTLT